MAPGMQEEPVLNYIFLQVTVAVCVVGRGEGTFYIKFHRTHRGLVADFLKMPLLV